MRLILFSLYPLLALVVSAQTNAPAPAITGIEAIDSLINASPIILVAVAIQLVGIAVTKTEFIPNKALPILNLVLGGAVYPAAIGQWNVKNGLLGILAGAGATGVYEVFRQFRPTTMPSLNPADTSTAKPDAIPTHPPTPNP